MEALISDDGLDRRHLSGSHWRKGNRLAIGCRRDNLNSLAMHSSQYTPPSITTERGTRIRNDAGVRHFGCQGTLITTTVRPIPKLVIVSMKTIDAAQGEIYLYGGEGVPPKTATAADDSCCTSVTQREFAVESPRQSLQAQGRRARVFSYQYRYCPRCRREWPAKHQPCLECVYWLGDRPLQRTEWQLAPEPHICAASSTYELVGAGALVLRIVRDLPPTGSVQKPVRATLGRARSMTSLWQLGASARQRNCTRMKTALSSSSPRGKGTISSGFIPN